MADERFDPTLHDLRQWIAGGADGMSRGHLLIAEWTARREDLLARSKTADQGAAKVYAHAAEAFMVSISILEKLLLRMRG